MKISETHDKIIEFIKDFFKDTDKCAIIGISGGKDSTVCAALLSEAIGSDRVVGVLMPKGVQADLDDAKQVVETLKIKHYIVNIGDAYNVLSNEICNSLSIKTLISTYTTNTPARLRMTTLYGIAAIFGGFVCNTCNRSEDYLGFSTKYGDACGDFSLLGNLTKREVVELGDYMKLPQNLVHKVPSDGMSGKSDEDNFGFTYDELDDFLLKGLKSKSYDKIEKMHNNPNTALKIVPMKVALKD